MTAEALSAPVRRRKARRTVWGIMRRDLRAMLSLGYLALLVIVSIFASKLAPYSPIDQNVAELLMPPSTAHWMGTDDLGRDVLSRLIWGAPNSLYASTFAVAVALAPIGVPIGLPDRLSRRPGSTRSCRASSTPCYHFRRSCWRLR